MPSVMAPLVEEYTVVEGCRAIWSPQLQAPLLHGPRPPTRPYCTFCANPPEPPDAEPPARLAHAPPHLPPCPHGLRSRGFARSSTPIEYTPRPSPSFPFPFDFVLFPIGRSFRGAEDRARNICLLCPREGGAITASKARVTRRLRGGRKERTPPGRTATTKRRRCGMMIR